MRRNILLIIFFVLTSVNAQDTFFLDSGRDKVKVPFQLINNLIFISLELNGVPMTFLVDSGVEETILFSLQENEEVRLFQAEKIKLRGLGNDRFIEALKSTQNEVRISKHLKDDNHTVFIILDEEINFSSVVGIPVNGIIGYQLFKNYLVSIDYAKKKITFSRKSPKELEKIKKHTEIPITVEGYKPYLIADIQVDTAKIPSKILVDTGNSDALWVFMNQSGAPEIPESHFDDFLGRGFSGDIYGKRAKIKEFSIADFKFYNPYAAFPDSASTKNVKMVKNRVGSVGGEILKRFHVIFDYEDRKMYLKKNSNYTDPFSFNMSGLEIHHSGTQWVQETLPMQNSIVKVGEESRYQKDNFKYKFVLKPVFEIVSVRKDSPADLAGLRKGDMVLKINDRSTHYMTLQAISRILKSEEGKTIYLDIERDGKKMKFTFKLKNIL